MLELAQAFHGAARSRSSPKPQHFVSLAVTAEEKGLLGSRYYAEESALSG